jgi:hypothetical protein
MLHDNADDQCTIAPTRSSLALRRHGDRWLIFREHGSGLIPHA